MSRFLIIVVLMLSTALDGCATSNPAEIGASMADESGAKESEKRLWNRAEEEIRVLDRSGFIYENRELEGYLNEIVRKVLPQEAHKAYPVKVKVIKNPALNAFAYPTGSMYMHTGILASMENEAQLAAVLGHELVHVINRHGIKEFIDWKRKSERRGALSAMLGSFGEALGQLSTQISVNGYSRRLESEADVEGLKFAVKAGYDPREAPRVFEQFKQYAEEEKMKALFVYSDHPKIQERIRSYEELVNGAYLGKGGVKNAEVFQQHTSALLLENAELDLKRGSYGRAERTTQKYLVRRPNDARAYFLLGEAYRQGGAAGGEEKAMAQYQKAISLSTGYPEPYRALGMMQYKKGEKQAAKKNLQAYLFLAPGAPDRAYIQQYIRECE